MSTSELEFWQERFAGDDYRFGTAPNAFLKAHAHLLKKGEAALAIADGEGRNGVFLAEQGLDVLSIDFSPNAQAKARALAKERGVTLRVEQADLINWDWPAEAFDVVAGIFFQFAGSANREKIFAGIKKTLKPGGLLLLEGYGPKQLEYKTGGPPVLENLYTADLLRNAFAEFSSVDVREYDAEIYEGSGHGGMSALVDLVGRK
ncbi:MAG: cyclopropane-fatty-acyl-phospholipid synthase family protein [Pseudolabrys sp.]